MVIKTDNKQNLRITFDKPAGDPRQQAIIDAVERTGATIAIGNSVYRKAEK